MNNVSINTATNQGYYVIQSNVSDSPIGVFWGQCLVYREPNNIIVQEVTSDTASDNNASFAFYRRKGKVGADTITWQSWQRIDNFGCNTAADLASLLGVIKDNGRFNGENLNLDDYKDNTSFNYYGFLSGTGIPESSSKTYGSVVVVKSQSDGIKYCLQIIANNTGVYIRHYWANINNWYTYKLSTV